MTFPRALLLFTVASLGVLNSGCNPPNLTRNNNVTAQDKVKKAGTTSSATPAPVAACDSAILRGDAVAKIHSIADAGSEVTDLVTSLVERNNETYIYGSFLVKDPGDQSPHPMMAEIKFSSECVLDSAVVLPATPEVEPSVTPSSVPSLSPSLSPSVTPSVAASASPAP